MDKTVQLKSAWLTTNCSCNNKCDWCYARRVLHPTITMDIEKAKLAVDMLEYYGVRKIVLIGGEPTIYPNLIELIQYISKKSIVTSLATNGRKFSNFNFARDVVNAGVGGINISLKANSEEEYLENTHQKGLDEALEGVKNLRALGFEPVISYVVVSDDKDNFDELVTLLNKENIKRVIIQFVKPALELTSTEEIMDIKKMGCFIKYIYNKMSSTEIDYALEVSFPLCLIEKETLTQIINDRRIITCCHVQRGNGIVLDTDFKVLTCNHFAEYPFTENSIDLNEKNIITDLWHSEIVTDFRTKAKCYPSEKCKKCELWNICGGGCFTRWFYLDPNKYI